VPSDARKPRRWLRLPSLRDRDEREGGVAEGEAGGPSKRRGREVSMLEFRRFIVLLVGGGWCGRKRKERQEPLSFLASARVRYDVSHVPGPPSRVLLRGTHGDQTASRLVGGNGSLRDGGKAIKCIQSQAARASMRPLFNNIWKDGKDEKRRWVDHLNRKTLGHSTRLIVRIVKAIRLIDGWIDG